MATWLEVRPPICHTVASFHRGRGAPHQSSPGLPQSRQGDTVVCLLSKFTEQCSTARENKCCKIIIFFFIVPILEAIWKFTLGFVLTKCPACSITCMLGTNLTTTTTKTKTLFPEQTFPHFSQAPFALGLPPRVLHH